MGHLPHRTLSPVDLLAVAKQETEQKKAKTGGKPDKKPNGKPNGKAGGDDSQSQGGITVSPGKWLPEHPTERAEQEAIRDEGNGRIVFDLDGQLREPPVPLSCATKLPTFPLCVLPTTVARYVQAVADFLEVPVDLPGMLALGAMAGAAQKKAVVQARPGWQEPLNLYLAVLMPPGEQKTAAFRALFGPHWRYEKELRDSYREEVDSIARQNEGLPKKEQRVDLPIEPRLFADDATPETLTWILSQQGERLGIFSDEATLFNHLCGMYSQMPNNSIWLKAHDGGRLTVDRRDGAKNVRLECPTLTMALAVQPDSLRMLGTRPELRGSGALARFLYSVPKSHAGQHSFDGPAICPEIREDYSRTMSALLHFRPPGWTATQGRLHQAHFEVGAPVVLSLHTDTWELFRRMCVQIDQQMAEGKPLRAIADWANKLRGVILRLAGLFHFTTALETGQNPCAETVSVGVIDGAWQLANYLLEHAKRAFGAMDEQSGEKDAQAILLWARREGLREFSRRTVQREGPCRNGTQLDVALELLRTTGWIDAVSRVAATRGRGYRVLFWPDLDIPIPPATLATHALC